MWSFTSNTLYDRCSKLTKLIMSIDSHLEVTNHRSWLGRRGRWLVDNGHADRIICRVPLIPGYNDETYQERSKEEL